MKRFLLVLILALPSFVSAQSPPDPMAQEAVAAFLKDDLATSRMLFEAVLATNPKDPTAQRYLRLIALKEKNGGGANAETMLKQIIIPRVELQDTTAREAMTYVSQQVATVSGGKKSLNVVWLVPSDQNPHVTLSLQNLPASEVMKYIADSAGLQLVYDAFAVKVSLLAK